MKTRKSNKIKPGDLVEKGGNIYLVSTMVKGATCAEQCAMDRDGRCNGFCTRFGFADGLVFRYLIRASLTKQDTEVVEIEYGIAEHLVELDRQQMRERKARQAMKSDDGDKKKSSGRKCTGSIERLPSGTFRASIQFEKLRYTFSHKDRTEVERWLEDFKEERGLA